MRKPRYCSFLCVLLSFLLLLPAPTYSDDAVQRERVVKTLRILNAQLLKEIENLQSSNLSLKDRLAKSEELLSTYRHLWEKAQAQVNSLETQSAEVSSLVSEWEARYNALITLHAQLIESYESWIPPEKAQRNNIVIGLLSMLIGILVGRVVL